jgi:hypothetical protein
VTTDQAIPTKAELLNTLRTTGDEVVTKLRALPPETFEQGRYESGWNGRQILAHIASIEWTYPRLVDIARQANKPPAPAAEKPAPAPSNQPGEASSPPTRAAQGGILSYNDRQVEKRAGMSVAELIDEFEQNRKATIAAVEGTDDELLRTEIRSAGGVTGPLGKVIQAIAVLHVLAHANDIAGSAAGS